MRIRTQLVASAALSAVVAACIVGGLLAVTARARGGLEQQTQSEQVARHVANMLALTNEFAVYGGERAAVQWRARQAQLLAAVDQAIGQQTPPGDEVVALRRNVEDLSSLFDKLVQIEAEPAEPLYRRRRDLLIERLLTETQEVVESRHRWAVSLGDAQQRDQRLYSAMVLAAPTLLLALLASLVLLVGRRVLRPLERLQAAAAAIQAGDLDVRCASDRDDELGDTARAVDAMAVALQRRSAALKASEHHLRLLADSLPALVAHIDRDERYTFANAEVQRLFGDGRSVIGRTMREVRGEANYATIAEHVASALAGRKAQFELTVVTIGKYHHATFVPDIDADGRVQGFYTLGLDITERRQAELRLQASERFLADITDSVPALVGYVDLERRYRFANANYARWLGHDPAAMIGKTVAEVVGEAMYVDVQPSFDRALAGERAQWRGETVLHGRASHLLAEYIPDFGDDGRVRGCYALTVDVTEQRQAELERAQSEERLLALTNSLPALVGYFDMQERCQYANDTALRSQGLERGDLPRLTLRDTLGEANYAQHAPYVKEALKGRRARLEGKLPFTGREAHFQAHLIPDRLEGGEQRGFYLMTFDITALKEAQQQQALVERQLRAITDNLPVMITYVDDGLHFRFVNATIERWVGLAPAAVVGRPLRELMPPDEFAARLPHFERALAGQRAEFDIELDALGVCRTLQNVYVPDIRPDGRVAGIFTLSTDVTALKQVERQLSLLARVDELTGLPNRRQLEERITEAIARASRSNEPLALMFLDIDHFKSINDRLGHGAGDAVLKTFARRLKGSVRITDTAARLAGDEFVVLLEGLHAESEAELVARKIVAAVRQPLAVDGQTLQVTTSIGIAWCAVPAADSDLMACADTALYDAKDAGRDTFRLRRLEAGFSAVGAMSDRAALGPAERSFE